MQENPADASRYIQAMEYTKARHEQMIEGRTAAQIAPTPTPAQPLPRQAAPTQAAPVTSRVVTAKE